MAAILVLLATRVLAMPKTLFEWDDYIFGLSLHVYAPQADVPQAPFFPLFVGAARLARRFVSEDVTALSLVSVASSLVAPFAVYAVGRDLFDRAVAWRAAVVYALLPAVWFHAGTPITDTAGAAASLLVLVAALSALRRPSRGNLALAFGAFGLACGVRPQSLVPAILPLLLAWLRGDRRARVTAVAAAALAALLGAVLPVVVAAGGILPLAGPLRQRISYAGRETSIFSGVDWRYFSRRWLRDPWVTTWFAAATAALGIAGAVVLDRRDRAVGRRSVRLLALSFSAYGLLCVVWLDPTFGSRYLLPLMPLAAILVAGAARELESAFRLRVPLVTAAYSAAGAFLVLPAILVVHGRPAPAADAAARLRERARPPFALLYTEEMFAPTELLFPGVPKLATEKAAPDEVRAATLLPVWRFGVSSMSDEEQVVCWPALPALERLTPGRYLAVPFGPWSRETPTLREGWSGEERRQPPGVECGSRVFRWIAASMPARAVFPSLPAGRAIVVEAEPDGLRSGAFLRVLGNGVELGKAALGTPRVALRVELPTGREGFELAVVLEPDSSGLPRRAAVTRFSLSPALPFGAGP